MYSNVICAIILVFYNYFNAKVRLSKYKPKYFVNYFPLTDNGKLPGFDNPPSGAPITGGFDSPLIMPVHLQRDALTPTIATHPAGTTLTVAAAGTTHALSVTATSADFGSLTYQWNSNTSNANTGGTALTGETAASFASPIDVAGTFYYYVVVTNTIPNNSDGGQKTATAVSNPATLTVTATTPPMLYAVTVSAAVGGSVSASVVGADLQSVPPGATVENVDAKWCVACIGVDVR